MGSRGQPFGKPSWMSTWEKQECLTKENVLDDCCCAHTKLINVHLARRTELSPGRAIQQRTKYIKASTNIGLKFEYDHVIDDLILSQGDGGDSPKKKNVARTSSTKIPISDVVIRIIEFT